MIDLEAEKQLVGSLLLTPERLPEIRGLVDADDFGTASLCEIFRVIVSLFDAGNPVDELTVFHALKASGKADLIGGAAGLSDLTTGAPSGANAAYYAQQVKTASIARQVKAQAAEAKTRLDGGEDPLQVAQALIAGCENSLRQKQERLPTAFDVVKRMLTLPPEDRLSTGYEEMDKILTGGLGITSFTVVGAGTSTGKTQFALNLAYNMRRANGEPARVLFICQEMNEEELSRRLFALAGKTTSYMANVILRSTDDPEIVSQQARYTNETVAAIEDLRRREIILHCKGAISIRQVENLAAVYHRKVDAIFLDYVQQCLRTNPKQSNYEKVSEVSAACKAIAGRYRVPVVGLSQIRRRASEDNPHPYLSDLRESGQIEQDADNVWLLWRDKKHGGQTAQLEMDIAKQRNGPTAKLIADFYLPGGSIYNFALAVGNE